MSELPKKITDRILELIDKLMLAGRGLGLKKEFEFGQRKSAEIVAEEIATELWEEVQWLRSELDGFANLEWGAICQCGKKIKCDGISIAAQLILQESRDNWGD